MPLTFLQMLKRGWV
nr:hypothetical protein I308_02075 [Cryptococcus tetragattii IND107]